MKHFGGTFVKSNVVPDTVILEYIRPTDIGKDIEIDTNLTTLIRSLIRLTRFTLKTEPSDFGISITPNVFDFEPNQSTLQIDIRAMLRDKKPLEDALNYVLNEQFDEYSLKIRASPAPVNTPVDSPLVSVARKVALSMG